MNLRRLFLILALLALQQSCASMGVGGDDLNFSSEGSMPMNSKELQAYTVATLRCFRTGGSRIVKLQGVLRCY